MNKQNRAAEFTLCDSDVNRLIDAATSIRDRLILKTLVQTGLRRGELCSLDVGDVESERQRILVRHGKGDKQRIVPVSSSLVAELRAYIQRRSTGPLFLSHRTKGRLALRSINHIVANTANKAGLTNPNPSRKQIGPHLLRHTFSRHYLRDGGRLHILSQILGHANVAITHQVYGTASEDEIQAEYQKIYTKGD